MNQIILQRARNFLSTYEGRRTRIYKDSQDIWTVGVGRNMESNGFSKAECLEILGNANLSIGQQIAKLQTQNLTEEQVNSLLETDIKTAYDNLVKIFGNKTFDYFSQNRQVVLISMMFNLGDGGFRKFRQMIEAIQRGDWTRAVIEFWESKRAIEIGRARLKAESDMMRGEKVI